MRYAANLTAEELDRAAWISGDLRLSAVIGMFAEQHDNLVNVSNDLQDAIGDLQRVLDELSEAADKLPDIPTLI